MLQQTQVATVIPYYARFIERFPTVQELAQASQDEVFQYWAGLGYYRRAKQLHSAAKQIVEQFNGNFPIRFDDVLNLPGIGRYTAGAILSFALGQRLPIVEANTLRLYARLIALKDPTTTKTSQASLWHFAERILPSKDCGHVNQAMMEIGSQVCTPKNPRCTECPFESICPTRKQNAYDRIPAPKKPTQFTELTEALLIVHNSKGEILLRRCSTGERWSGLWDFPRFDATGLNKRAANFEASLSQEFCKTYGVPIQMDSCVHKLKHGVTRYRISLSCFPATLSGRLTKTNCKVEFMWASKSESLPIGLNASAKRVWDWVTKAKG